MTSILTSAQRDRAAGVLLGTAIGDALGAGYEFTHPRPDTVIDMIGGGPFDWAPGEWTDDTSMATAVALAAVDGPLDSAEGLDRVAANFVRWYATEPADVGNQTRAVLSVRPASAATMAARARSLGGRTGGNGALMRTAPVALTRLDDPDAAARAARAVSLLTHHDERSAEACALWTHAIARAVVDGTFAGVRGYLGTAAESTVAYWSPLLDEAESVAPEDFPNNGWVVHAMQTAWWAISTTDASGPGHVVAALEACVRAGGDTDTTAAIAGGLLGARWGASAIPARWRRVVHGYPGYDAADLEALALAVVDGGPWPRVERWDYSDWPDRDRVVVHPHDDGVVLGGVDALDALDALDGIDAVVSLCRVGSAAARGREHVTFRLIDGGSDVNPHLDVVVDDAAGTVLALRREGKRVLLHCVQAYSRTPSVAARYSRLLGRDPRDVLTAMPWARPHPELWESATR